MNPQPINAKPISLGRGEANDIVLHDSKTIGRVHLLATLYDDDSLLAVHREGDTKSKTFLNGRPVQQAFVRSEDILQLGEKQFQGKEIIQKVKDFYYKDKTDFTREFTERVLPLFKAYEEKRKRIEEGWLNILPKMIPSVAMVMTGFLPGIPNLVRVALFVLGIALSVHIARRYRMKDKLEMLEAQYEALIKCPKCSYKLLLQRKGIAYFQNNKHCPKCAAKLFS